MENVPDVVSDKNKADFFAWCEFLEGLGYTSKYDIMNAKDYGIPQNRERCFMLSWLGDEFYYDFPEKIPLTKTLKDVLEKKVDEKYYLSDEAVSKMAIADETAGGGVLTEQISKTVRTGGRGSLDRHCWDIVVEPREEV